MVAQHSHLSMRIILRPQEFVHHSCEYTQRCTMLVLTIVRPFNAIESGRVTQVASLNFKDNAYVIRRVVALMRAENRHATEATSSCNVGEPSCVVKKQDRNSVNKVEKAPIVTEVVTLMEGEWSRYRSGHFNGGKMVMSQRWSV